MGDLLYSFAGFVVAIGILVAVHEFGHFWVARRLGVQVLRFSIGFGRPLWRRLGADGTEYAVGAIPLGGYVKMLDEREGDVPAAASHRAFNRQSLAVRSAVVVAGPMANFLFAVVAYWVVLSLGVPDLRPLIGDVREGSIAAEAGFEPGDRIVAIDGRPVQTWGEHRLYLLNEALGGNTVEFVVEREEGAPQRHLRVDMSRLQQVDPGSSPLEAELGLAPRVPEIPPVIGRVLDDTPAAAAGLASGDVIASVAGRTVDSWRQVVERVTDSPGQPLRIGIHRQGTTLEVEVVPEAVEFEGRTIGRIGVERAQVETPADAIVVARLGLLERTVRAAETTWLMTALTIRMLIRMVTRQVSTDNISGPITIAHYAGQTAQIGVVQFITFLAIISISLGILNLLPIPVLDGGHLLYFLVEAVKGSPVSEATMLRGQQVGILIIAALMGLAFYNDFVRLLT